MADSPSWKRFWHESSTSLLVASSVSLASSVALCVLYWLLPPVRRTPGGFIVRATVCEVFLSTAFVYIFANTGSDLPCNGPQHCQAVWFLLVAISALNVGANVCRSLMYFHLLSVYRNPFKPHRHRMLYRFLGWGSAALMVLVWNNQFDNVEVSSPKRFVALSWWLFFVPYAIFILVGGTLYVTVRALLGFRERPSRPALISSLAQQRVSRHGLAYLLLYGMQHNVALVVLVWLYFHPSFWLLRAFSIFKCSCPAISFLGWIVINDVVYMMFGVCSFTKTRCTTNRRACLSLQAHSPSAGTSSSTMASEMMAGSDANGLRSPTPSPRDRIDSKESSESSQSVRQAMAHRAARVQGMDGGFKEELRFELLYDIVCSIGDLALDEHRYNCNSPDSRLDASRSGHSEHILWRRSVSDQLPEGFLDSKRLSSELQSDARMETLLASAGLLNASDDNLHFDPPVSGVVHYEPEQFRAIRAAFGISTDAYLRTFPKQNREFESQWRQNLSESISEGASGSFFYRVLRNDASVCKSDFIIKQVTFNETRTLMRILPDYVRHVTQRQGRSLIQYFGCHSVPLRWKFSSNVYFVVMRNFLPVKSWLTFDLKGATANRRALAENLLHHAHAGADPRGGAVYGTLRDWEWMDIAMAADLSPQDKAALVEIVAADAEFLKSQGLLDYSLLVGIHRLEPSLKPSEREEKLAELLAAGGYPSVDRQKVYFFGIIDVLERYTLRWKAQHFSLRTAYGLSCKGGADGISAMPPAQYADRFFTFVQQEVLHAWPGVEDRDEDEADINCCRRWFCCRCRSCVNRRMMGGVSGGERWGPLWERRRRGLVRERISIERTDFLRRIEELEAQVQSSKGETV